MKISGEDIIITQTDEMSKARKEASRISASKNHSWAHLWYIDSCSKLLTRETYSNGKGYSIAEPGNYWFTSGKRALTILDAMTKYGTGWVKDQAVRLSGTGKYSTKQ